MRGERGDQRFGGGRGEGEAQDGAYDFSPSPRTFFWLSSCSSSAACSQIFTDVGRWRTALARIDLAFSTGCRRAASSHTSSASGQASHPCRMIFRAWGAQSGEVRNGCQWRGAMVCSGDMACLPSRPLDHTRKDQKKAHNQTVLSPKTPTCTIFPANSSTRAAAIQPGPCLGFVEVTELSKVRARLMSPTSASEVILRLLRSVRYPLGSTTV